MTADGPTDLATLLAYLADEMREAGELLRGPDVEDAARRSVLRKLMSGIFKTPGDLTMTMAMRYLPANIDRAGDHWRAALDTWRRVVELHPQHRVVQTLTLEFEVLGLAEVLPKLDSDALPSRQSDAATFVAGVLTIIRDCEDAVVKARTRLRLQRMREPETDR